MKDEASYICDSCGEEIVLPIDLSAGTGQEYVEDCPVCCRANIIHVEIDEWQRASMGHIRVRAEIGRCYLFTKTRGSPSASPRPA